MGAGTVEAGVALEGNRFARQLYRMAASGSRGGPSVTPLSSGSGPGNVVSEHGR
jgi:hypothetical protein